LKQETIFIESPEKIRFRYKIAHTGTRIGAYLVDIVIQTGIILLLVLLLFASGGLKESVFSPEWATDYQMLAIAFLFLVYFFLCYLVFSLHSQ